MSMERDTRIAAVPGKKEKRKRRRDLGENEHGALHTHRRGACPKNSQKVKGPSDYVQHTRFCRHSEKSVPRHMHTYVGNANSTLLLSLLLSYAYVRTLFTTVICIRTSAMQTALLRMYNTHVLQTF